MDIVDTIRTKDYGIICLIRLKMTKKPKCQILRKNLEDNWPVTVQTIQITVRMADTASI